VDVPLGCIPVLRKKEVDGMVIEEVAMLDLDTTNTLSVVVFRDISCRVGWRLWTFCRLGSLAARRFVLY